MPRDPFASAHFAETVFEVQHDARLIFGKYDRLQRPDAMSFRSPNQSAHQRAADAAAARRSCDVNADFGYASVDLAPRHRTQRGPAKNVIFISGHQSALRQMTSVPTIPVRRFGFKGSLPC